MMMRKATLGFVAGWALLVSAGSLRAIAADTPAQEAKSGPPVAAVVNGEPIYISEVLTVLVKQNKMRNASAPVPGPDFADNLNQLILRRLVVQMMKRKGGYFTDEEADKEVEKLKAAAAANNVQFEDALAKQGVTADALRNEMIWQIAWPRYLERNLTEGLQSYFNAHRKEFDGTQVQASHILLRAERASETLQHAADLARKIREAIESGKITFEQAAERFSVAPSRATGGDIGRFPRHGVMHEAFAQAAFELEPGQVSQPITTPFGVHLIRVTNIMPGTKQWTEVLDSLRAPASIELFEQMAKMEIQNAKVEFNPNVPHFNPENGNLVTPTPPAK